MEIKDIQNFIKFVSKSGVAQVTIEMDNVKISVKNELKKSEFAAQQQPTVITSNNDATPSIFSGSVVEEVPKTVVEEATNPKYKEITSPMVGTFYRKANPKKQNLVEVGTAITADTDVCVLEAMKTFNEVKAGINGKIVEILVKDASPVEFGQPLFLVDPC